MHQNDNGNKLTVLVLLALIACLFCVSPAIAQEQMSLPIPIPLLGDNNQAGLAFDGVPFPYAPEISALWCGGEGTLSFILKGDITALYCWRYQQGEVTFLDCKDVETSPDTYLLEGAKKQGITSFFAQGAQLYGFDDIMGNLYAYDATGWRMEA